jgi:hypothetical protein
MASGEAAASSAAIASFWAASKSASMGPKDTSKATCRSASYHPAP